MATNRFPLPKFKANEPLLAQLTAARLNAILDAIDRAGVIFGDNVRGRFTSTGTIIDAKPQGASSGLGDISFAMEEASPGATGASGPSASHRISIVDGKVNGHFPDGMGSGDYVLPIEDTKVADGHSAIIFVGASIDFSTLAVGALDHSLWLQATRDDAVVGGMPGEAESRVDWTDHVGTIFLYYPIGFCYLDSHSRFQIQQTYLGDINYQFSMGAYNGVPAIIPINTAIGWLDTTDDS